MTQRSYREGHNYTLGQTGTAEELPSASSVVTLGEFSVPVRSMKQTPWSLFAKRFERVPLGGKLFDTRFQKELRFG